MSFSLAARVTPVRNVKTRVFTDPTQYDTEINAARGFSPTFDARVAATKAVLKRVPQLAVTETDVMQAQDFWAQSIVDISNSFLAGEDYVSLAGERAGELYGYDHSNVLFKPTKASQQQFRPTAGDAMSYFVGHDAVISGYKEDQGFAINAKKGFSEVVFDNHQIDCHGDVAHAMGTYEFTCATTGEISEVEYTFGYKRNDDGKVRICLHHSSIPYESGNKTSQVKRVKSHVKRKIMFDPDQYDSEANEGRIVV
tara:strand:- start:413 stop:1174 length:762 start_codon:yes stop_codon:yes gene_type:complete